MAKVKVNNSVDIQSWVLDGDMVEFGDKVVNVSLEDSLISECQGDFYLWFQIQFDWCLLG